MFNACLQLHPEMDIEIMAAAVADYRPADIATEKIKKNDAGLSLQLIKTKDILATLGADKKTNQLLIGFALETNNERENARNKLQNKNADMIVLNSLKDDHAGFGFDTNKVSVYSADDTWIELKLATKKEIANSIVQLIIEKKYA
jgi:phosphopantothenoylcysteine decarboxylase/phosphopantothenate--cysteine ligase